MNKKILNLFKKANNFEKLISIALPISMQPADVQDALGVYFNTNKANIIINDFAQKYKLNDDTHGTINIRMRSGGSIEFVVSLTAENQKEKAIASYLKAKYGNDMSSRILNYGKMNNTSPSADLEIKWITL